jgi:hypothetical protein
MALGRRTGRSNRFLVSPHHYFREALRAIFAHRSNKRIGKLKNYRYAVE